MITNEQKIARNMAVDALVVLTENWRDNPYYNNLGEDVDMTAVSVELWRILHSTSKRLKR
jgi:hypothetical protein